MPALPLDEAGKYVAAAYLVFLVLILIYVAIMAAKLARVDRELASLDELRRRGGAEEPGPPPELNPPGRPQAPSRPDHRPAANP